MRDIETAVKELIENFPDFIGKMKSDDMQPYILFGDFGIYIRDGIDKKYLDEAVTCPGIFKPI